MYITIATLLAAFCVTNARPMGGCNNGITCLNITANNLTFQCRTAGNPNQSISSNVSKNVLLLHGFPEFSEMYSNLMRTLAQLNYSSIACNQRGYSLNSPNNINDYLYPNLENDAFAVAATHFGVTSKFHLIGHDHGALLGWKISASNPNQLLSSYTALSVPHADAFSNGLYGPEADIEQQIASQYFTMFIDKDSASSHFEFWWLTMGKFDGNKDSANIWKSSQDFQKTMWWYNGAMNSGIMAMVPIMTASQILSHGVSHAAIATLRTMWGGTANNGTRATHPIGNITNLPTLYICGSKDPAILCNRSYALKTKNYIVNGTYTNVVVDCGHDLLTCTKTTETSKVVASIVAHLQKN